MKQTKCPCCGEKVYQVYVDGIKILVKIYEDERNIVGYNPKTHRRIIEGKSKVVDYRKHCCELPKKLQVEK